MASKEGVVVQVAHIHDGRTFLGLGRGENRAAAEEAAIKDLLTVLPVLHRRPLVRLRGAGECQSAPWELWVRL